MKLEPLYRIRFTYPQGWAVTLSGERGTESQYFFLAEGRCTGRIQGTFRGANHPRRRVDNTFIPDFQGVIETSDGATIFFDLFGYGRAYPQNRRQIVAAMTHLSDHESYRWLNDVICACTGEVRTISDDETELVIDVAELVWEPIEE